MIFLIFYIILSFFIGAIPTGYIIGRLKKIDIREHGSKNIGATNVTRTLGPALGLITLIIDSLKGFLVLLLFKPIINNLGINITFANLDFWISILSLSIICGNIFNPFLKFKGGKGVATGLGIMLYLNPAGVGISFLIFLLTVLIFKYISLGSIIAVFSIIISSFFIVKSYYILVAIIIIGILIVFRHK